MSVVGDMVDVLGYCYEFNPEVDKVFKSSFGDIVIMKSIVNVVYILNNYIYVGQGLLRSEEKNFNGYFRDYSFDDLNYIYNPKFITVLKDSERDNFLDLLRYEQVKWGNIKISFSPVEYIKNDFVDLLYHANSEVYHKYNVDSVSFYDVVDCDEDLVLVNVCLDNCDVELFYDYLIHVNLNDFKKEFEELGEFRGEYSFKNIDNPFYVGMSGRGF